MHSVTKSTLAKDYRGISKLDSGFAGWGCPCCNSFSCSPRRMKVRARRMMRRVSKRTWKAEVEKNS